MPGTDVARIDQCSSNPGAGMSSQLPTISYQSKSDRVLWPEISIATRSGITALTMFSDRRPAEVRKRITASRPLGHPDSRPGVSRDTVDPWRCLNGQRDTWQHRGRKSRNHGDDSGDRKST